MPFYVGMLIKAVVITIGFGGVLLALFYRGYHCASWAVSGKMIRLAFGKIICLGIHLLMFKFFIITVQLILVY